MYATFDPEWLASSSIFPLVYYDQGACCVVCEPPPSLFAAEATHLVSPFLRRHSSSSPSNSGSVSLDLLKMCFISVTENWSRTEMAYRSSLHLHAVSKSYTQSSDREQELRWRTEAPFIRVPIPLLLFSLNVHPAVSVDSSKRPDTALIYHLEVLYMAIEIRVGRTDGQRAVALQ